MIVSAKRILELNKKYKLVENIAERELNQEEVGIDLRAGKVYKLKGQGFWETEERKTPIAEKIAESRLKDKVTLKPSDYLVVKTIEKANITAKKIVIEDGKEGLFSMVEVYPRSTLQRCGISFFGTKTDLGYYAELTFALANLSNSSFELELEARIANLSLNR